MRIRSLATCCVLVLSRIAGADRRRRGGARRRHHLWRGAHTDAYLKADLTCPGPNGLSIGATITLDLRRHTLTGPGKNGTGIGGGWMRSATVSNSVFRGNRYGASVDDSGLTLTNSVVDRNETGVYCYDAYCQLTENVIRNNTIGATNGFIGSFVMTKNLVSGNDVGVTSGGYSFVDRRSELQRLRQEQDRAGPWAGPAGPLLWLWDHLPEFLHR